MSPRLKRRLWYVGAGLLVIAAGLVWLLGPKQQFEIYSSRMYPLCMLPDDPDIDDEILEQLVIKTARRHDFVVTPVDYPSRVGPSFVLTRGNLIVEHAIKIDIYCMPNPLVQGTTPLTQGITSQKSVMFGWVELLSRPYLPTEPRGIGDDFSIFRRDLAHEVEKVAAAVPAKGEWHMGYYGWERTDIGLVGASREQVAKKLGAPLASGGERIESLHHVEGVWYLVEYESGRVVKTFENRSKPPAETTTF